jgi:hypothetical protein
MSLLQVNTIKPLTGTTVAVTGTLEVSGTIKSYALETIVETEYLGSNSFGNDTADTHQFTGSLHVSGATNAIIVEKGRVGIGTSSPSNQLEIEGSSGDLVFEIDNNASNSANFQIQNGAGNARVDLVMNDGSDNTTFTMKGQRFGLNTTSPKATLDVNGAAHITGSILPGADNSHNLGSSAMRWANVYTGDLHLKNDRGDWTILEESDYLCVVNNATGKKYKMMLQEIDD